MFNQYLYYCAKHSNLSFIVNLHPNPYNIHSLWLASEINFTICTFCEGKKKTSVLVKILFMPFFTSDHYCQTLDILTTLSPFTGNKITLAEFCYNYTREFEDFLSNLTQMSNTPGFKIISLSNQRMVFFFFLFEIYLFTGREQECELPSPGSLYQMALHEPSSRNSIQISHVGSRNPAVWPTTTISQDLHLQEAGVRYWSQVFGWMWASRPLGKMPF